MNTLQQGQLKILNGLADDMPIEMNAGQLRALLATARAEGAAEERERIKQAWKKLNIMGAASAGSAQGVIVRNPWGETDGMQVDREAFRLFMQALTTKEPHAS